MGYHEDERETVSFGYSSSAGHVFGSSNSAGPRKASSGNMQLFSFEDGESKAEREHLGFMDMLDGWNGPDMLQEPFMNAPWEETMPTSIIPSVNLRPNLHRRDSRPVQL